MARGDQHRPPCRSERLDEEHGGLARDVVLLEKVTRAGDQVALRLTGAIEDPEQGGAEVVSPTLRADSVQTLAGE